MILNNNLYKKIFLCLVVLILSCFSMGGLHCHYDDDDDDDYDSYVSIPDRPDGPSTADVDEEVIFETGGSYCFDGHEVEYRFDFGDSEQSTWSKNEEAKHTYKREGIFRVTAQARCSVSHVTSSWSNEFRIAIDDRIELYSLWKDREEQLWTVGKQGKLLMYASGQKAKEEKISDSDLYGIWGTEKRLFCCGSQGTVLGYIQDRWQKYPAPATENLYRIAGIGDKLFIVGEKGTLLHFDGKTWNRSSVPTQENLYGIWVHKENSVFAAGAKSTILHYNGEVWKKYEIDFQEDIYSVWGNDYCDVWAAGEKGILLHFDGNDWKRIFYPDPVHWKTICGFASEIYIGASNGTAISIIQGKIEKTVFQRNTGIEAMFPLNGYRKFCILNAQGEFEEFFAQ